MRIELAAERVSKVADTDSDRERLGREARALRACAHPGVVPLVGVEGDPPDRLILGRLRGGSLAEAGQVPFEVLIGQAAAVITTLADLHDLGWVHGSVMSGHVLFDDRGRPVLCGFGAARAPHDASDLASAAAADVAALAALIRDRLPVDAPHRLIRLLAASADPSTRRRSPTARQLGLRLVQLVPDARLEPVGAAGPGELTVSAPGTGRPADPATRRLPEFAPRFRLVALAVGISAATGAALLAWSARSHPATRPVVPGPDHGSPRSSPPQTLVGPTDTYRIIAPAGSRLVTVAGRWGCGPAQPVALDVSSGWVWIFPRWPAPGSSMPGKTVARVRGAVGLAVEQSGLGCDRLVAVSASGRQTALDALPTGGAG